MEILEVVWKSFIIGHPSLNQYSVLGNLGEGSFGNEFEIAFSFNKTLAYLAGIYFMLKLQTLIFNSDLIKYLSKSQACAEVTKQTRNSQ